MSLRVVIADDSAVMRGRAREALMGIKGLVIVAECSNGQEALETACQHKPDVLVLDNQMPFLTGTEVADALTMHNETRDIKVLLCTSVGQVCVLGNRPVLKKPFHRAQMHQAIFDLFGTLEFPDA